jgi:hypothetical protein
LQHARERHLPAPDDQRIALADFALTQVATIYDRRAETS